MYCMYLCYGNINLYTLWSLKLLYTYLYNKFYIICILYFNCNMCIHYGLYINYSQSL